MLVTKHVDNAPDMSTSSSTIPEENYDTAKAIHMKTPALLVDTGATSHIVNDEELFINIDKSYVPENHYIELADGSKTNSVAC